MCRDIVTGSDPCGGERPRRDLTPVAILEALAASPAAVTGQADAEQAFNTRRLLGMPVPARPWNREPPRDAGSRLGDTAVGLDISTPTVVGLGANRNVLGALQSVLTAVEKRRSQLGGKAQSERHHYRANDVPAAVAVERNREQGGRHTFFASVGTDGPAARKGEVRPISTHAVRFCGEEYCVCGVVYRITAGSGSRFVSQIFFEDGWWTYSDTKGGGLDRTRREGAFDDEFYAGSESLLMFVRTDELEKRFGGEVIPPWPATGTGGEDEVSTVNVGVSRIVYFS